MVKLKDIAEQTGFSVSTISRVLNDDATLAITNESKDTIINTALKLGYPKDKIKVSIYKVAVYYWVTDLEELQDIYYREISLHLKESSKNYKMNLHFISKTDGIKHTIEDADAFIAVGGFSTSESNSLKKRYKYGVFLESNISDEKFDTVNPDLSWMTKDAIKQFLKAGHKKIGLISGSATDLDTHLKVQEIRELTFRQHLKTYGLLNEDYIFTSEKFTVEAGHIIGQQIIDRFTPETLPSAFLVASDSLAVGVLQVFNEHQIHVPTDTSIISINDINIAKYISPSLTTYHIDRFALANTAVSLLADQINYERNFHKRVFIGASLVKRDSFKINK